MSDEVNEKNLIRIWIAFTAQRMCFAFFFFFWEKRVLVAKCSSSKSCALFMGPTNFFLNKTFIKNESHGTIHTFKNYFTTMFLIFNKINDIQTDP